MGKLTKMRCCSSTNVLVLICTSQILMAIYYLVYTDVVSDSLRYHDAFDHANFFDKEVAFTDDQKDFLVNEVKKSNATTTAEIPANEVDKIYNEIIIDDISSPVNPQTPIVQISTPKLIPVVIQNNPDLVSTKVPIKLPPVQPNSQFVKLPIVILKPPIVNDTTLSPTTQKKSSLNITANTDSSVVYIPINTTILNPSTPNVDEILIPPTKNPTPSTNTSINIPIETPVVVPLVTFESSTLVTTPESNNNLPFDIEMTRIPEKYQQSCENFDGKPRSLPFTIENGDGEGFNFKNSGIKSFKVADYSMSIKTLQHFKEFDETIKNKGKITVPDHIFFFNYNPTFQTLPYLCSLESAAKHNPIHKITIFVENLKNFNETVQPWLNKINFSDRLHVEKLDYEKWFKGTPFEGWYSLKQNLKSHWPNQNLGNAFRLAVIWHIGGIYMDMDIITVNTFKDLKSQRLLAREDGVRANNAILNFPASDPFIWAAMEVFVNNWNGYQWAGNGPLCMTRTLMRDCYWPILKAGKKDLPPLQTEPDIQIRPSKFTITTTSNTTTFTLLKRWILAAANVPEFVQSTFKQRAYCKSLEIAGKKRFYPIHYTQSQMLVDPWWMNCGKLNDIYKNSIGLHWWNSMFKMSRKKKEVTEDSLLSKVMKDHCPNYWMVYGVEKLG